MSFLRVIALINCLMFLSCSFGQTRQIKQETIVGAERLEDYLPLLKDKVVGLVANHTSLVGNRHLADTLLTLGVNLRRVFAPEHGFRGVADAGEQVGSYVDERTGIPVISLYGTNRKPKTGDLEGLEIILFDIQDVGVRFYTYLSTMHYVMEACAEQGIEFLVLDRPNPNGYYVDGPVLDMKHKSFVGMHPIPLVHGMTLGELAQMINKEGWLEGGISCSLTVIPCKNYTHKTMYRLPVRPSPNLPNMLSVYLYPSLGLFEGTVMNVGRGTEYPFQVFGHPDMKNTVFSYTPISIEGMDKNPKHREQLCRGVDLRDFEERFVVDRRELILEWLQFACRNMNDKDNFFIPFFSKLIGNEQVAEMIRKGAGIDAIRHTWQKDVSEFKRLRKKYLLYQDFE